MSRQARASELQIKTELPERGDQERETSSFWFRRVTTAVLLGNGGGIVALASYLANTPDKTAVAALAYPALASFFSGTVLGFVSYTISLVNASLRFDSHMNLISRAAEIARKAGKKTAATQHDGVFGFLILLAIIQFFCLFGAGISFYKGATYILSFLGKEACKDVNETYCYGSPIIFPFVNPRSEPSETERPLRNILKARDFKINISFDGTNTVDKVYFSPPDSQRIKEITSSTTVQVVSPSGELCLFSMPYFADGGLTLVRPRDIEGLISRMSQNGFALSPVSTRAFIKTIDNNKKAALTVVNVGYIGKDFYISTDHIESNISIHPFKYGIIKGISILHEGEHPENDAKCLKLTSDAGFEIN